MNHILLIEDEPGLRADLATLLRCEGHRVTAVADGSAGLAAARQDPPTVVLCDIQMPGLDGHAVLRDLRADPALCHVIFIFITARASLTDLREGMRGGADDYLPKPFTSEDLLATLEAGLVRAEVSARRRVAVPHPDLLAKALGLTPREADVLHWVAHGKSNPEIAIILGMGLATVKTHLIHLFTKLGVEGRGAAALRALDCV